MTGIQVKCKKRKALQIVVAFESHPVTKTDPIWRKQNDTKRRQRLLPFAGYVVVASCYEQFSLLLFDQRRHRVSEGRYNSLMHCKICMFMCTQDLSFTQAVRYGCMSPYFYYIHLCEFMCLQFCFLYCIRHVIGLFHNRRSYMKS